MKLVLVYDLGQVLLLGKLYLKLGSDLRQGTVEF